MRIGIVSTGNSVNEAAQNGRIAIRLIGEVLDRNHTVHPTHGFFASYKKGAECKVRVFVEEIGEEEKEIVYQMSDHLKILGPSFSFTANF
jgi:hypothetical protein